MKETVRTCSRSIRTKGAPPSSRCSMLSRIISDGRLFSRTAISEGRAEISDRGICSASASASAIWPALVRSASGTYQVLSRCSSANLSVVCMASRVFPVPPGPVRVSKRGATTRSGTSLDSRMVETHPCSFVSSCSRPKNRAAGIGIRPPDAGEDTMGGGGLRWEVAEAEIGGAKS